MSKFEAFEKQFTQSEEDLIRLEELEKAKELLTSYLYKDDAEYRVKLREEFNAGAPMTGPEGIRKKLAAVDLEYFGRAYLPHYFVRTSPAFHRDLDDIWEKGVLKNLNPLTYKDKISRMKGCKRAIAAPRGHAKSTNLTFKDTIHAISYGYKHYPMILSDSSSQAEGFLGDIKVEFEENAAIIEDFGSLVGRVWRDNIILTANEIKVEAIGSGMKIRGRKHRNWRPDLIVLDDIENDENVRTLEQRKKLADWYFKAVSKVGDDYTDIVYIGTLLHYNSLLAKILKNPGYKSNKYKAVIEFSKNQGLWDMWEAIYTDLEDEGREEKAYQFYLENKEEMLEGTKVLWEDKLSYYDLMVMKTSEGVSAFNSEEQNEPVNPEDCLFNPEWFDFYNEAEIDFKDRSRYAFFGFLDPSLGKKKNSDYSTFLTIAKDLKAGYFYVVDADIARRHPDQIIKDVLEKERWLRREYGQGFTKLGVETNQFQWFLKEQIAKVSAQEGLYLPIEEVYQNSDKTMRIQTLQPYIKNRYIKFTQRAKTLLEQLKVFPMGAHDDGPDALEGAVKLALNGGSTKAEYKSVLKRLFNKKGAY